MGDASIVAAAFRYPRESSLGLLRENVATLEDPRAAKAMANFLGQIEGKTLAEWEELHTETLDLSPKFVPYVGHAVWGENYRRGAFMADLSRSMAENEIDLYGELPDHLDPIMRYIDNCPEPLSDVVEVLEMALMRMSKELKNADKGNPYRHALDAAQAVAEEFVEARRKAVTP